MRFLTCLVLACLSTFAGHSAYAQEIEPPPFNAADPGTPLLAQAQPATGVTTTVEPQTTAPAPADPSTNTPNVSPRAGPVVDETALRYFARQGDTERLQAEMQRLRNLHPGWEPPTDLLSNDYVPDADIVRMWELFNSGDFAGARAALATKEANDPSFVPSDDLLKSLALGEAGLRLRNASDAKQYETVLSVAANFPDLLTCESIDNLWRLAEAFAASGNVQRAVDAYSYVLTNCSDAAQRYATVQKALVLLDRADLDPLLVLERKDAEGRGEFAELRVDLARRAVAASLEEGAVAATSEDIALLEQTARANSNAEDMRLLGWSELARNQTQEGRRWFEMAMEADPSAESAQGLGAALLELDDPQAAEAALAEFMGDTEEVSALYLGAASALLALQPRIDLEGVVLNRIVAAVMEERHAGAAQELGWYAYDFQQPETAVEWFNLSLRWQSDLEPAAYGLMVASNALGDTATVESIRNQWGTTSTRIAEFGRSNQSSAVPVPVPRPRPVHQPPLAARVQTVQVAQTQPVAQVPAGGGQGSSGSRGCVNFVPALSLSAGAALSHGWCLMELNRPAQAVEHFTRALQSGSENTRSDAAYGLSLAYIRLGLADNAAVAAAAAPITDRRAVELEIAILSEKAISAYNIGDYRRALDALDARARYAPERNDLLTLRAWSYYHLRRFRESQRIFEAVAATGFGDAVAGLQAANAALLTASN